MEIQICQGEHLHLATCKTWNGSLGKSALLLNHSV
jgi:hypothetical protein